MRNSSYGGLQQQIRLLKQQFSQDGRRSGLTYNLLRTMMAQAALAHKLSPRWISFKGTIQVLEAFQFLIPATERGCLRRRDELYAQMLCAIATHRVANRLGRYEPRLHKRRPKHYG